MTGDGAWKQLISMQLLGKPGVLGIQTQSRVHHNAYFAACKIRCVYVVIHSIVLYYAAFCGVMWRGVAWCGVVWRGVAWCGVVWRGVAWCGVAWRGVVRCAALRCAALCCAVLRCAALCCAVLRCAVLRCSISSALYPSILFQSMPLQQADTDTNMISSVNSFNTSFHLIL